ncbi:alpha/beta fold hydrolase [Actinoplanes sp. CA-142083]|uniref:alpha/beta fold hydrolase n=1 Tax=Actinoplanes sp. CA-142083 TaxID=3239903 RepID=UPI003D8C7446
MLVYDRWGEFGRPVVLLHGLLFDRTMWWPVAAELASAGCTIVAPDLPGHGQSPPRDDYRLERVARDLAGLVDNLGLRRAPLLVGHGASALLAAVFADAYATHEVVMLDEPSPDARRIEEMAVTDGLDQIPDIYRCYAEPSRDPALLRAYESWAAQPPTRRNEPAMAGPPRSSPGVPDAAFLHLADPEGFAAVLRGLL